MLIGSTVSPFIITEILHKWILTTSQGKQKTDVCVRVYVFVCVCACWFFLIKIFSVLISCTRCILRLIRYILLQFFYAYKMTILNNFLTPNCAIFIGFSGYPVKKKKKKPPPPQNKTKQTLIPILAACFSQRRTTKVTKNQAAQKNYDSNDCI